MKRCGKHPKYMGKGKPRTQCERCLEIYLLMCKPRMPIKPTKLIRDRSKYSRKPKHKNNDN